MYNTTIKQPAKLKSKEDKNKQQNESVKEKKNKKEGYILYQALHLRLLLYRTAAR